MVRGGSGAASSRGRGKFKVSRGGGRHFSRDISAIDHEMESLGLEGGSGSESESEEESSEESSDDGLGGNAKAAAAVEPEMSRAERKALKKAQGGKKKGPPGAGALPEGSDEDESDGEPLPDRNNMGPSRKEKEAAAKEQAAANYQKAHAAGKTDQFKKDMERLQEVKRRREREAAERKAKDEEAKKEAADKAQARLAGKR